MRIGLLAKQVHLHFAGKLWVFASDPRQHHGRKLFVLVLGLCARIIFGSTSFHASGAIIPRPGECCEPHASKFGEPRFGIASAEAVRELSGL